MALVESTTCKLPLTPPLSLSVSAEETNEEASNNIAFRNGRFASIPDAVTYFKKELANLIEQYSRVDIEHKKAHEEHRKLCARVSQICTKPQKDELAAIYEHEPVVLALLAGVHLDPKNTKICRDIYEAWGSWPWEVTDNPPKQLGRKILDDMKQLVELGCSDAVTKQLLGQTMQRRLNRRMDEKLPRQLPRDGCLQPWDTREAVKSFKEQLSGSGTQILTPPMEVESASPSPVMQTIENYDFANHEIRVPSAHTASSEINDTGVVATLHPGTTRKRKLSTIAEVDSLAEMTHIEKYRNKLDELDDNGINDITIWKRRKTTGEELAEQAGEEGSVLERSPEFGRSYDAELADLTDSDDDNPYLTKNDGDDYQHFSPFLLGNEISFENQVEQGPKKTRSHLGDAERNIAGIYDDSESLFRIKSQPPTTSFGIHSWLAAGQLQGQWHEVAESKASFSRKATIDLTMTPPPTAKGLQPIIPSTTFEQPALCHTLTNDICTKRNQIVPTNDLLGALSSLAPGQWLSSTAIQLALDNQANPEILMLDPHYLSVNDPRIVTRSNFILPRIASSYKKIIAPIHHRLPFRHWTIAMIDLEQGTMNHYDSLHGPDFSKAAEEVLSRFADSLHNHALFSHISWKFCSDMSSLTQCNDYDCGIYTVVTGLHLLYQIPLPTFILCDVWRHAISSTLAQRCDNPDRSSAAVVEMFCSTLMRKSNGESTQICDNILLQSLCTEYNSAQRLSRETKKVYEVIENILNVASTQRELIHNYIEDCETSRQSLETGLSTLQQTPLIEEARALVVKGMQDALNAIADKHGRYSKQMTKLVCFSRAWDAGHSTVGAINRKLAGLEGATSKRLKQHLIAKKEEIRLQKAAIEKQEMDIAALWPCDD